MPLGCLVATTTASVLLLTPRMGGDHPGDAGRPTVQCRSFRAPQGLLGSISRRVSSLIFGSSPSHHHSAAHSASGAEARLVKLLSQRAPPGIERRSLTVDVQVLCSQSLQSWQVNDATERLLYQVDLDKWVREALIAHVWSRDAPSIHQLRVWILDAQFHTVGTKMGGGELVLLVAAVNPNVSAQQVQYALASVPLQRNSQVPPAGFGSFSVLKFAQRLPDHSEEPERCRLVLNGPGNVYVYSDRWILCVPSSAREPVMDAEPERLDVRSAQERFLGGGVFNQRPVFFSSRHGVLVLQPSAGLGPGGGGGDQSILDESVLEHSQVMADVQTDSAAQSESSTSKLKLAFFNFCRKNVFEARTLLEDLFASPNSKGSVDSLMDRMAVELSQKIIDDYPASDPRWTDSVPAGHESTFTTVSLLVLHQLDDKVKAHDLYLTFLRYKQRANPFFVCPTGLFTHPVPVFFFFV